MLGLIGLGRMGLNMAARLTEQGVAVVGVDAEVSARAAAADAGVRIVPGVQELIAALPTPRVVWIMVPSRYVDEVLDSVAPLLSPDDVVIDGGNSFYKDSLRRYRELRARNLRFLDVGTSGGVSGARNGASIMVGGELDTFLSVEGLFAALAVTDGYARVGGPGAGHFVKMVHNGIEYGMMGAIAEGMGVLHEYAPEFGIDLTAVLKPYEHESIISGKLMTWLRQAYEEGQIEVITGEVPRGETESEMEHITTIGEVPVLEAALEQRRATRVEPSYVGKLIAAMRNRFGGHRVIPIGEHESSN